MNEFDYSRRKHERVEDERDVLLLCDRWRFPVLARTVNCSEGGYMVLAQYAIRENTPLLLAEIGPNGFDIESILMGERLNRAEIRWCSDLVEFGGYAWGMERV